MHELAVTENILAIAKRHGENAGAVKVTDIHLVIGRLSSIVDESIQFYWDLIAEGTLCEGAKLHFNRTPATLRCNACQHEYTLTGELIPCPSCGSPNIQVLTGEEFFLESIEITREEETPPKRKG